MRKICSAKRVNERRQSKASYIITLTTHFASIISLSHRSVCGVSDSFIFCIQFVMCCTRAEFFSSYQQNHFITCHYKLNICSALLFTSFFSSFVCFPQVTLIKPIIAFRANFVNFYPKTYWRLKKKTFLCTE